MSPMEPESGDLCAIMRQSCASHVEFIKKYNELKTGYVELYDIINERSKEKWTEGHMTRIKERDETNFKLEVEHEALQPGSPSDSARPIETAEERVNWFISNYKKSQR